MLTKALASQTIQVGLIKRGSLARRIRSSFLAALKKPQRPCPSTTPSAISSADSSIPDFIELSTPDKPDVEVMSGRTKLTPLRRATIEKFVPLAENSAELAELGFTGLGVDERLGAGLLDIGATVPTPVQAGAIPNILGSKDCAVQCYTGSGKTLAYLLPALTLAIRRAEAEYMDETLSDEEFGQIQALVVAPSRELAMQIVRVGKRLLPPEARRAIQQCIGGANMRRQIEALRHEKPLIVVGTAGRLADHSRMGTLQTHKCPLLILDEVDQLMAPHFQEAMLRLTEHCGKKLVHRQTVLVSATLTPKAVRSVGHWAPHADFTFVGSKAAFEEPTEDVPLASTSAPKWGWGREGTPGAGSVGGVGTNAAALSLPPNLHHGHVLTPSNRKVDVLRKLLYAMNVRKALVFMNFQRRLQDVMFKLSARKIKVACLHGEKSKLERENILRSFTHGDVSVLVVSDVAARGLDIPDCDAVFNLEMPSNPSHYVHRAGRTGRMDQEGWVVSLVTPGESFVIQKMSHNLKVEIPELEVAGGEVRIAPKKSKADGDVTGEGKVKNVKKEGKMRLFKEKNVDEESGNEINDGNESGNESEVVRD